MSYRSGYTSMMNAGLVSRCVLTSILIPIIKIRRSHDCLIFIMGIPLPGKDGHYSETGNRSLLPYAQVCMVLNKQPNVSKLMTKCKLFSHRPVRKAMQCTCRHSLISACHIRLRSYWLSEQAGLVTSISVLPDRIVLNMTSNDLHYIGRGYIKWLFIFWNTLAIFEHKT